MSLGAKPEDVLYANPVKHPNELKRAKEQKIGLMTFDCIEEAKKIYEIYPEAELLLRIAVDNSNQKYGA